MECICRVLLSARPDWSPAYLNLALALLKTSRALEAKEVLVRAPAVVWDSPITHWTMACIEMRLSDRDAAFACAERVAEMNRDTLDDMAADSDLNGIRCKIFLLWLRRTLGMK